jgi:hypothetical protein
MSSSSTADQIDNSKATVDQITQLDLNQYEPLTKSEDSRILSIEPATDGSPISCKLPHVSFSTDPVYKALSCT